MKRHVIDEFKSTAIQGGENSFEYTAVCTACGKFLPFTIKNSIEIIYPENHTHRDNFRFSHYAFKAPINITCSCMGNGNGVVEVPRDLVQPVRTLIQNNICVRAVDLNRIRFCRLIVSNGVPTDYFIIPNLMIMEVTGRDMAERLFTTLKTLISENNLNHLDVSNNRIMNENEENSMDEYSDEEFENLNTPDVEQLYLINIYNVSNDRRCYESEDDIDHKLLSDKDNQFIKLVSKFAEEVSNMNDSSKEDEVSE